ncbi:hypothetical protein RUM44_011709 [Polyplax serrata]|uniref:Uncharacterized protein n=1 Tax=Polyplax serrata TaxID=468196 RepID=A0ABR1AQV3_POLSC
MFSSQSSRAGDMCKWCLLYVVGFSLVQCLKGDDVTFNLDEDEYHGKYVAAYETDDAIVLEGNKKHKRNSEFHMQKDPLEKKNFTCR